MARPWRRLELKTKPYTLTSRPSLHAQRHSIHGERTSTYSYFLRERERERERERDVDTAVDVEVNSQRHLGRSHTPPVPPTPSLSRGRSQETLPSFKRLQTQTARPTGVNRTLTMEPPATSFQGESARDLPIRRRDPASPKAPLSTGRVSTGRDRSSPSH